MGFTFSFSPKALFEDRFPQILTLGIRREDAEEMRNSITDMWLDAPGGWVHEWSRLAERYSNAGDFYVASLAFGWAKFPCLANDARHRAFASQVTSYLKAAPSFPVKFERREIAVEFRGTAVKVPVHIYSASGRYDDKPVLLVNGGVDTWKMDFHPLYVGMAQRFGVSVMAFDQPGTGETPAPLIPEADEIVLCLVRSSRELGNGKVAHFGSSFGANYSAMTGLLGVVDCSIVLGGPVDEAFSRKNLDHLPYGMPGIIGNDIGFDHEPSPDEFATATAKLSRRRLLDRPTNAPMLVINGADDYFVPQADTNVFRGRPDTEVYLIDGTGHCAFSKLPEVLMHIASWLPKKL